MFICLYGLYDLLIELYALFVFQDQLKNEPLGRGVFFGRNFPTPQLSHRIGIRQSLNLCVIQPIAAIAQ